jgi:alkanesulfonate monooxygenase SsuD/methylene tetrahydromethanopterin reductase-like flavin-dependent oxidoreductase (luciferase family)
MTRKGSEVRILYGPPGNRRLWPSCWSSWSGGTAVDPSRQILGEYAEWTGGARTEENLPVRVGVSLRSGFGATEPRQGVQWMVERARAAREAGLDSLFVGDHHVTGDAYYQNSPVLGRLLAEWGHQPAGALYLLPLWHPVLVAEQVATLAAIAAGPFILQCALGDGVGQFAGMGIDLRRRPSRFELALSIVRRLLAGEEVSASGPWPLEGARVGPVPRQPVEVWVGAAAAPAIDRAARLGDAWLAGPYPTLDELVWQVGEYTEACEAHGRSRGDMAVRRDIHVGSDDVDARRVAEPVIAAGYRGLRPEVLVVGGPETVAEEFRRLGALGFTDVIVRHLAEDQAEVLRSFERLAEVRRLLAPA